MNTTKINFIADGNAVISAKLDENDYYKATTITKNITITASTTGDDHDGGNQGGDSGKQTQTLTFNSTFATTQTYTYGYNNNTFDASVTGAQTSVSYRSNNPAVAEVTNVGEVTTIKAGQFTITATADENETYNLAEIANNFTINKKVVTIEFADGNQNKNVGDSSFTKVATIETGKVGSQQATYTYSSSNTSAATINQTTGEVSVANSITEKQTAKIQASIADDDQYYKLSQGSTPAEYTITVYPDRDVAVSYNDAEEEDGDSIVFTLSNFHPNSGETVTVVSLPWTGSGFNGVNIVKNAAFRRRKKSDIELKSIAPPTIITKK